MMKKISSIITLLFIACTMILGGGAAFAEDDPKPTAIAPPNGDLTIHKYLYDADGIDNKPGDGKELKDTTRLDGKEIRGIQFDVYEVGNPTEAYKDAAPKVVPGGDGWTYTKIDETTLEVSKGTDTYRYDLTKKSEDTKTNNDGEIVLKNLSRGYYFVEENLAASTPEMSKDDGKTWAGVQITTPVKSFVVAVPMTDPENLNNWITDVHVYPKNQGTEVVKEPSKPSVNVGDEFSWSIAVELPVDIKDYKKFVITDILDESLTYTTDSVKIYRAEKVGDKWQKVGSGGELVRDTDYTLTEPGLDEKGGTLEVKLLGSGFAKVDGWKGLIVEFNTTVNEKLEGKEVNIIGNKATVEFTNSHDEESERETDESEVNTGDIIVDKKDENDKNLPNSEFQIARTDKEAKDEQFIKIKTITVEGVRRITEFVYPTLEDGTTVNPDYKDAEDWIVKPHSTKDANYFAKFEGLQTFSVEDDVYMSYWLVETKAPKDYNLLGDPVEVNFKDSEEVEGKKTYNLTTDPIVNHKGFTLPNTGGIGTMLLIIVGIILVGMAIILNMNNKKKKA
ncbi:SpaH/EbpB family LPXTG-anchored major pilin [Enterococcus devriesei]|uniref:SpaH/EbpB family LPXTG-anchored major pilin n=1 Tax=Enterococcus devriesei TaxID=319970 RepID=UPI00288FF339|nr:SpaH/EbpB family LPXTG-anchored major pilin [Enterococcus devriesei]MDT2821947.1 SpaH/EbpB family LPXTG-anchored major pilin [Enterococcus devriesei]